MPLVRLEVRNVYGLEKTELHSNVEREDTKAILDGVAVSGLVGILRQLGDLTEFAAEIFHGIQEEVMITSSRSSKLKMRLKQIEATVPSIQKKVIAQTNHIHFAYTGGLEWHPRIPNVQNQFIYNDLPQFVMAPYEDSRDPPRLHLLDKFDVNGPGSCLKRYSDPTHFKSASRASKLPETKKKKSVQRNRDISSLASIANQSDRKASTCLSFSGRTSSSKSPSTKPDFQDHRSCSLDSRSGGEKKPKGVFTSSRTIASVLSETESEDANDSLSQDQTVHGSCCVSWHEKAEIVEMDALQCAAEEAPQVIEATNSVSDADPMLKEHIEVEAVQDIKPMGMEMDSESEGDDFVDAPYTIDSESENDQNNDEEAQKKSSNEITEEKLENSLREEQETGKISNNFSDDEIICAAAASDIRNGTHSYYSNGFSNPLYDTDGIQEHQESEDETSCDTEATKLWTNGNLVGVKPKVVAEVIPENDEDTDAETFQEPLREDDNKAYFDWFASSPQLDHMKISFNHSETLQSSELKLKLAEEDTFPSFQLVPETATAIPFPDSDSDKDTFCRSSSYISDNSDNHSVSISEQQWVEEEEEEVEEIRESKIQEELYDSFHKVNPQASSLSAPSPQVETPSNGYLAKNLSFLQNPAEPLPPPLPPIQWMVSKIPSGRFEDNNNKQSLQDTLIRELKQNNSLSTFKKQEPTNIVIASHPPTPENNVQQKNNAKDYKQSHGNKKETEAGDFLHQIRTKQFNLRRVVTTRTYVSEAAKNTNFSLILEKANSIRQAVASDDGDGESDTWSDSDT